MAREQGADRVATRDIDECFTRRRQVGVGAGFEQHPHGFFASVNDGVVERAPADTIEPIGVGAPVDQQAHDGWIGASRGLVSVTLLAWAGRASVRCRP